MLAIFEIRITVMDQAQEQFSIGQGQPAEDGEVASIPPRILEAIVPASPTTGPRQVALKHLINKLNYLNFQNKTVLLAFEHAKYGHTLRVEARPQPCQENYLRCTWVDPQEARAVSRYYVFSSLFVPDEQKHWTKVALDRMLSIQ